jgi:hypothetical protein
VLLSLGERASEIPVGEVEFVRWIEWYIRLSLLEVYLSLWT